jgi:hypothetical protein
VRQRRCGSSGRGKAPGELNNIAGAASGRPGGGESTASQPHGCCWLRYSLHLKNGAKTPLLAGAVPLVARPWNAVFLQSSPRPVGRKRAPAGGVAGGGSRFPVLTARTLPPLPWRRRPANARPATKIHTARPPRVKGTFELVAASVTERRLVAGQCPVRAIQASACRCILSRAAQLLRPCRPSHQLQRLGSVPPRDA